MTETVGVVPPRAASVVAAEIDGQLTGGHNAGRSITRKLAIEARDALERAAALREADKYENDGGFCLKQRLMTRSVKR